MADATHTEARFNDENAAREHLESILWPRGPVCPHCGGTERNSRLSGASHRPGLLFCGDCRSQFTVTVGTVFERSKVPLHKWVYAVHLMCASKKGISSKQIERMLGVTYKTAWFMSHRIREAMNIAPTGQLDQAGAYVKIGPDFASHETVNHNIDEYARGDVTTNTVEASFSLLKRGLIGTFHSVSEQHLQRYATEFDFRWNYRIKTGYNDIERAEVALKNISGKRLTYRRIDA